jgi:hypothetical protein
VGPGLQEGTMEEAVLYFFYCGVSPWIRSFGYKWIDTEELIAQKFLHCCYMISLKTQIRAPEPKHRNFPEDRETFEYLIDSWSFTDFLKAWEFFYEIIGTPYDFMIFEFCYIWVNVSRGKPGNRTQKILDSYEEDDSNEELNSSHLPEVNWKRRKDELY